ncbi:MAG: cyanophycinase [Bacteroidales bacterium]
MNKLKTVFFLSLILILKTGYCQDLPKGSLVIVGGGLEPDNKSLFTQLIELSGGPEKAVFSIIPSASGVATQAFVYFRSELIFYGVKPENIHLIPIAMADDDSTKNIDESTWLNNGSDLKLADIVRKSTCVWFSGGDQLRTMKTLHKADGSKTPVLEAVWEVFRSGGVVGGTSAGAAIMSEPMIGAGNSMGALKHGVITDYKGDDFPDSDGVLLTHGLGFFPLGMVDQHFNTRARLARLVMVMMHEKKTLNLGFGVDENTALIYNGKLKILKVAGAAGVTMVNTTDATISQVQNLPLIKNVMISYLDEGDVYDISTKKIIPAEGKKSTIGNEFYNVSNPSQTGMFSGSATNFLNLVTVNLIDNKAVNKVSNLNFTGMDTGFRVTLSKTPESKGYFTDKPNGIDKYTVIGIRMDIEPVQITTTPLK